jgi:PIN domain nuclease of toxin-antitoxin system
VNLLLDTHTFLWWDEAKLPAAVVDQIQRADEVFVSAASAWEIAIKAALNKIVARAALADAIRDYGFSALAISVEHGDAVRSLPPHHRDPFDRMLVAQARVEELTIVTRDPAFVPYGVPLAWG